MRRPHRRQLRPNKNSNPSQGFPARSVPGSDFAVVPCAWHNEPSENAWLGLHVGGWFYPPGSTQPGDIGHCAVPRSRSWRRRIPLTLKIGCAR